MILFYKFINPHDFFYNFTPIVFFKEALPINTRKVMQIASATLDDPIRKKNCKYKLFVIVASLINTLNRKQLLDQINIQVSFQIHNTIANTHLKEKQNSHSINIF